MGRRAAETTNPVPALGVPLTRGRVVLEPKWGPLCSVGVQTSPGLCSLPSLKRRAQSGVPASMDTMSLDRVKPVTKQALQKCTSNVSQDDSSQGGIYCQIKSIRANPNCSGCRGNLKLTSRYTNGSIAAPELVGGVSSEGVETREVDSQCQATVKDQKRGQSLRSERPHLTVQRGNSCTTPTRPCRLMMSPRLCSTCGRKQPQAPPSITPNKRSTSQIQASMTLPAPLKKDLPRLQKQPSADTPTTNTSKPSISATQAQKTHDSESQTKDTSAPETKAPVAGVTMEPMPNKTCKNTTPTVCLCKKERIQTSSQHTQTHDTLTSMSKAESKATHQKQHAPQDTVRCTEECVNKQTHVAPVDKASTVHDSPKPPPPVLSIGTEFKATPTLSCKVSSHTKATEVTSQSISPYLFTGSKSTPQTQLSEQKNKAEPETKSHPKDLHLQQNDMLQIPQCNGVPEALHELLQGVEENLLSNQEKIKVLLNVIQDLEKSKALSEGRCSYRTGQDINNCMTCQKTACTIYSVEHDFRLQEMRLQSVLEALDVECEVSAPIPKPATSRPRTRDRVKKLHKKCFWWL